MWKVFGRAHFARDFSRKFNQLNKLRSTGIRVHTHSLPKFCKEQLYTVRRLELSCSGTDILWDECKVYA